MRGSGTGQEKIAQAGECKLHVHCDLNNTRKRLILEELRPTEEGRSSTLGVVMVGLARRDLS